MNSYTKYIGVKSVMEDLFGSDAWYALKETNHVPTWRKYADKTLRTVRLAITDTVEICDPEWLDNVCTCIDEGIARLKSQKEIDEIIGVLAGTMIEVSFWQVGNMPRRKGRKVRPTLRQGSWNLNGHRSVIYLQTKKQREAQFIAEQRRKIGFEAQLDLQAEHRRSKSPLSYLEWCGQQQGSATPDGS